MTNLTFRFSFAYYLRAVAALAGEDVVAVDVGAVVDTSAIEPLRLEPPNQDFA